MADYMKYRKILLMILCILLLAGLSGTTGCSNAVYHKITAEEAMKMMEESSDFILLDVRTEDEFRDRRIEGAILIPHNEIENRAKDELPDKGQLILVYCRSGQRSQSAANILVDMGYTKVYDFGGINDWPYETVSG
jgi:rhodanese-related sulfurtransferase